MAYEKDRGLDGSGQKMFELSFKREEDKLNDITPYTFKKP